jgi:hypothetical protein
MVAYFVRGGGERWAVIRLTDGRREEVITDGLSKEAAIERCYELLEELPRDAAAPDELPLDADLAPRRRRPKQLSLKF